ncbi:hypothetical protein [Haladaptatus cibarius]|uniref:hypothetical protein n=1 Tax=Haladaptatus cibarius TaxID=453847 RepID=UPI000A454FBD|nr:hypothetical protein [Haladaptatus cibarius]
MSEYSGYLVFNQIHQLESDFELSNISRCFDDETNEQSDPLQLEDSIKEVLLPARTVDQPVPREFLRIMDDEVRWFRYKVREFTEETGIDSDGEQTTVHIPNNRICDIFITSKGYVFFKGTKSDLNRVTDGFYTKLRDNGLDSTATELEFDPDFFLWLIYNQSQDISGSLLISRLTDAEVVGEQDAVGRVNQVSGSDNVARSAPVLTGLLRGKKITMVGGIFEVGGIQMSVDIRSEGRIHIKSDKDISKLESEGRIVTSVSFLHEFCNLYDSWKSLPNSERYPPTAFFNQIYEGLGEAGFNLEFSVESVLEEYKQKRGE